MKKRLFSLALVLALCLGLAVPAAGYTELPDEFVTISNMTAYDEDWNGLGPGRPVTCTAPAEIVTVEDLVTFFAQEINNYMEAEEGEEVYLEVQNKVEIEKAPHTEKLIKAGAKIVITEPGVYFVSAGYCRDEHKNDGGMGGGEHVYYDYCITVKAPAGQEKPTETEKPEDTAAPAFSDVAASSPFAAAIDWAVEQKIAAGYEDGTFRPGATCTVSHILTFLWRASGKPGAAEGKSDAENAAAWAVEKKMVESTEGLSESCTRSLAVTFLWKAAGSPEVKSEKSFTDVAEDAAYLQAVAWAVENGVTAGTGDGTTFSPDATCTRGQIATFLYRANQK